MEGFVTLLSIAGLFFSGYLLYTTIYRAWTIEHIDKEIIDDNKRKKLIYPLKRISYIGFGCLISGIISLIFPVLLVKAILAIIPVIICANLVSILWDEIEKFDLKKKDSEIVKEFLERAEKDAIKKSK